ncbi:hypothetical protein BKA70DRAFT_1229705 [Coprinopsis sp. MPI-PUGE-AT-0042]|nr:hypothetical protein BKA70DRAFT_1229705 [Coprinopsis sp. MPI-PUGE-AT-0042]
MRVSPLTILVASVAFITTAHASFADWDADEFDARGVGSAFNPDDEDFVLRSYGFADEDDYASRDLDDEESHFYAREWEDGEDLFRSFDDEWDLDYSLRDMGVEDNQEMFERAMADMDSASELALRGEIVMRELEEDEMEIQRRQIEKAQKTLSGMTPPAVPAPSAIPPSTPGGVPKVHWKLAPVNCKAVTNPGFVQALEAPIGQAEKQKNTTAISAAKTRLAERKELQKRLVWALLMQGRVLN